MSMQTPKPAPSAEASPTARSPWLEPPVVVPLLLAVAVVAYALLRP